MLATWYRSMRAASILGWAARSLYREPEAWRSSGTVEETLQHLKQLWHVLVRYGYARSQRLC